MTNAASSSTSSRRIFLLSPASLNGVRAAQLTSRDARFETARRYRGPGGVPIDEAFAFLSALYFRGKITYARHFATPPKGLPGDGILIITPGFGLVPPSWPLTPDKMETLRETPVDAKCPGYTEPLREHAEHLRGLIPAATPVVLLGSVATGKYVDVLEPVFGKRLVFPKVFAGAGDMRRGALMLRAVREEEELEYVSLDNPRHGRRK
jgi:hypothetical protein